MEPTTNQYEQERRQKMLKLRELGVDPFGGRVEGVQALADVRAMHKPEFAQDGGPSVKIAGRLIFIRDMGKLQFARLRDETGELQIALDKKRLSEADWNVAKLLDLGDQIVIEGPLGATKTGEVTVWAKQLAISCKSLLPPPEKWSGLADVELRYRQRYVDLFTNPDVMRLLRRRSEVVAEIRRYMSERGYLEVETPMMQPIPGGATARPFITHHRALDIDLYLRIAPELYLKRLLVGGFSKVFELNRNFRNEGISPRHNPEFTMLEAYQAYGSWETMAELVEGIICNCAEKLFGGLKIYHLNQANRDVVETYMQRRDMNSMDQVCRARLEPLSADGASRFVFPATEAEQYAISTASEGYERGQDGFDKLIVEYERELAEKSIDEQRACLSSKFAVKVIDLTRPWRRVSMVDLVADWTRENVGHEWRFDKRDINDAAPEVVVYLFVTRLVNSQARLVDALSAGNDLDAGTAKTAAHISETIGAPNYKHGSILPPLPQDILTKLKVDASTYAIFCKHIRELTPAEQLQEVYEKLIEPTLIDPTFVTHVPSVIIPLAKTNRDDPFFADVYELAINGQEISPGYTELNDPDVQEENFKHQVGDKEEQQKFDEDFVTALRYGMPPAGGMGLGIDRLVMMLSGAESIRDVILFPLMKPQ